MKKYFLIILVISMFSFLGCSKSYLNETPKGSLVPQNFYKTANDLNLASAGIAYQMGTCFSLVTPTYFGADDITAKRSGNKFVFSDYDVFMDNNTRASNARMAAYFWNPLYATIKQANALIANYQNAKEATVVQQNNAGGYAYFIRATCYYYLTRTFGNIPMPLKVSTDSLQNSTVAEIYTQIVSDLKNAETLLPNHWSGNQQQNGIDILATAGTAKAMMAEVYLTMAGWPLKQTDKYALAAQKAKEVIDNKATWGYDLLPNYGDLWKIGNKYNKEAVFACYYNNQAPNTGFYNGTEMGPPSLAPADEGGWDDLFGEITFFENFPTGPRKNATYQFVYYPNNDPSKATDWEHDIQKHPYFLKYRDDVSYDWSTHTANDWWGSATSYLLRYSSVLLTYAEAEAMSTSPDANAYAAVNAVRARAAGQPNDLPLGLSQTAFRDSVVAERGWEYAAEFGSRWYDLLRTETVAKANSTRNAGEAPLLNQPNDSNHDYYWSPIPVTQ